MPLFKERLTDKDPKMRRAAAEGLGRVGDASASAEMLTSVTADESEEVRVAMAFALQRLGRNYLTRIVDAMDSPHMVEQAQDYLIELGPPIVSGLFPHLQESDAGSARVLPKSSGYRRREGGAAAAGHRGDRDPSVAAAAKRAIERIKSVR